MALGVWKINGVTIPLEHVRQICTAEEEWFRQFGTYYPSTDGGYIYQNNGGKVLGVVHLDIATNPQLDRKKFFAFEQLVAPTEAQLKIDPERQPQLCHFIRNDNLDDRLGAAILLAILPRHLEGIGTLDWLLTTNEEIGRTTARDFMRDYKALSTDQKKEWNWIVQFDRRGEDVVMYGYDDQSRWVDGKRQNGEWSAALAEFFTLGTGSFSCISSMEGLGVKGVNIGIGYHGEHFPNHFAVLEQTTRQINRFRAFFEKYQDTKFSHTENTYRWNRAYGYDYEDWGGGTSTTYKGYYSDANRIATDWSLSEDICPLCSQKRTLYASRDERHIIGCNACLRQHHNVPYADTELLIVYLRRKQAEEADANKAAQTFCDWCGSDSDQLFELEDTSGKLLLLCNNCYGADIDQSKQLPIIYDGSDGEDTGLLLETCEICTKESFDCIHYFDRTEQRQRIVCSACYNVGMSLQVVPDLPKRNPPPRLLKPPSRRICSFCGSTDIFTTLTLESGHVDYYCEKHYWDYRLGNDCGPIKGACDLCGSHCDSLNVIRVNNEYFEVCDGHPPVSVMKATEKLRSLEENRTDKGLLDEYEQRFGLNTDLSEFKGDD